MGTQSKRPIKLVRPWALSRIDQSSASTYGHSVETTNQACPLCCREVRACKQSLVHHYIVHTAVFWTFQQPFKVAVNCCPKHSKSSCLPSSRRLSFIGCSHLYRCHGRSRRSLLSDQPCSSACDTAMLRCSCTHSCRLSVENALVHACRLSTRA